MGRVISSSEETAQQALLRELARDTHTPKQLFHRFFPSPIFPLYFFSMHHPRLCISMAAYTYTSSSSHLQPSPLPPVMAA